MIIKPMIRNNICLSSHPVGCQRDVQRQIAYVKSKGPVKGPKSVLVVGSSTGYGLASRIVSAFGSGAATLGVAFEKPGSEKGPGTAGYYNTRAFEQEAQAAGLWAKSLNGDAFSNEIKAQVIEIIKKEMGGKIGLLIYSLASPVRTDPRDGVTYRSALKPRGKPYTAKSVDPFKGEIKEATIEPATPEEEAATVKVMGGEDWELWVDALTEAGVLEEGFQTVAYSYIGPEVTAPFYREGTIGKAKEHLEATVDKLNGKLAGLKGRSFVSVNKALVTKASAVIPVVSLYVSVLYKVMKEMGLHEGCIEQIDRLYRNFLYAGKPVPVDAKGLIRIDDWEMRTDVQAKVMEYWHQITAENLKNLADLKGFEEDFLQLNGFAVPGVDYEADVGPDLLV